MFVCSRLQHKNISIIIVLLATFLYFIMVTVVIRAGGQCDRTLDANKTNKTVTKTNKIQSPKFTARYEI